jgi:hypothetical protein
MIIRIRFFFKGRASHRPGIIRSEGSVQRVEELPMRLENLIVSPSMGESVSVPGDPDVLQK